MTETHVLDRRALIAESALLTTAMAMPGAAAVPLSDFSFQNGQWTVHHRKLRKRLAGSDDWYEFRGTATAGSLMAGMANYEDNILDDPTGAYRAAALRRFDAKTALWSIWWWDGRFSEIDPPVTGRFENGVGTFVGDSMFDAKAIRVRYVWDMPTAGIPRWRQAFSADGGNSWEINWLMEFQR